MRERFQGTILWICDTTKRSTIATRQLFVCNRVEPSQSVMAAEERFQWFMNNYLKKGKEAPLGKIVDYVCKKEYQKRGAVHWHMLLWIEPGTIPVVAEMPCAKDTKHPTAKYVRRLVKKQQMHGTCTSNVSKRHLARPLTSVSLTFLITYLRRWMS